MTLWINLRDTQVFYTVSLRFVVQLVDDTLKMYVVFMLWFALQDHNLTSKFVLH
jgi:hypothetical protein